MNLCTLFITRIVAKRTFIRLGRVPPSKPSLPVAPGDGTRVELISPREIYSSNSGAHLTGALAMKFNRIKSSIHPKYFPIHPTIQNVSIHSSNISHPPIRMFYSSTHPECFHPVIHSRQGIHPFWRNSSIHPVNLFVHPSCILILPRQRRKAK